MKDSQSQCGFSPQTLLPQLATFAAKIDELCHLIGLDAKSLQMDHIAMRINQHHDALLAHQQWSELGRVISQAQINGRPIIVLELDKPITLGDWTTQCIELPYPAAGKTYPEQGWEHVEFVLPCTETDKDKFIEQLKLAFPKLAENWPLLPSLGVVVKTSSPQGEGERLSNPTIAFKWNQVCVKLHPYSLKEVIASEQL